MSFPIITAHAGCAGTKPNTLYSVEMGIEAGADILEVDVRNTKDGVVILYHDDYINKIKEYKISELSYAEVLRLEPTITRLYDVLKLIKKNNKVVNLDVKDLNCICEMLKEVKESGMTSNAIITGLKKHMINSIEEHKNIIPIIMSAEENVDFNVVPYIEFAKNTCDDAISCSAVGINLDFKDCRKELIEYARLRSLNIFVWTVDNEEDMKNCMLMGVASITTHEIKTLKKLNY